MNDAGNGIPYGMGELLPIVAGLADKFTSKESTSVTYERAHSLMEAVLYCIRQLFYGDGEYDVIPEPAIDAKKAYEAGYEIVIHKVRLAQERFNCLIEIFDSYGNENYRDTVEKALPGFFLYYNPMFAPMDNIITMDYPVLGGRTDLEGIHAIETYIDAIWWEQVFLNGLPKSYIIETLTAFHKGYKKQFFNICNPVLRRILLRMLTEEYSVVRIKKKSELKQKLRKLLEILIREKYGGNEELFHYLSKDLDDFVFDLFFSIDNPRSNDYNNP